MPRRFAEGTSIEVEKSRNDIRKLLVERLAATAYLQGEGEGFEAIMCNVYGRRLKFELPVPKGTDGNELKRKWRALVHRVKSKVIAIEEGITEEERIAIFEDEFMAALVMPDGRTMSEIYRPQIGEVYESQQMPALLPGVRGALPSGEKTNAD